MIIFSIIGFVIVFSVFTAIVVLISSIVNKLSGRIVIDQAWMLLVPFCIIAIISLIAKSEIAWVISILAVFFLTIKIFLEVGKRADTQEARKTRPKEYIKGISLRRGRRR